MDSQRDHAILQHLQQAGSARTTTLARALGVSGETVRRHLAGLAARGLVAKTHGGAHLVERASEPSFAQRMAHNPEAKRRIARAAARLVPDGAALFLDVGSTTAYVAQALQGKRDLLVVTNSLAVAHALVGRGGNRVFMAGGELRAHDGGAFGAEALAFVEQFRLDLAVLSVAAIHPQAGFLLQDLREAEFARAMMARAGASLVVADAEKFDRLAPIRLAEATDIARLVTDAAPPAGLAEMLQAAGVEVTLA